MSNFHNGSSNSVPGRLVGVLERAHSTPVGPRMAPPRLFASLSWGPNCLGGSMAILDPMGIFGPSQTTRRRVIRALGKYDGPSHCCIPHVNPWVH